jgi:hypothetical protein
MNDDDATKISSPIYLIRSSERCWKCGIIQEVIALATMRLCEVDSEHGGVAYEGQPFILNNIEEMPQEILNHIRSAHPRYEKRNSRRAGSSYYMNTCVCGAHFRAVFLHGEPGGAFFPSTESEWSKSR